MDRRSYEQFCGLAKALDVVGERWTMLVVRNLLLGPLRYSDLMRGLPGITTNLLAKRLREMEAAGLIEKVRAAGGDAASAYRLTSRGAALEPVVHALSRWGWSTMTAPGKRDFRSFDFLMVALRRLYRGGVTIRAEFVADGARYRVLLDNDRADISRGDVTAPDLRLSGPSSALAQIFLEARPASRLPAGVTVEGSSETLRVFLGVFGRLRDGRQAGARATSRGAA